MQDANNNPCLSEVAVDDELMLEMVADLVTSASNKGPNEPIELVMANELIESQSELMDCFVELSENS